MRLFQSLDELHSQYDVAIVGAGPAGMAAAITTSETGLRVVVIEASPVMGGRGDHAWRDVRAEIDAYRSTNPDHLAGARLTALENLPAEEGQAETAAAMALTVCVGSQSRRIRARRVIVATGAIERPMEISGWTLPGVSMLTTADRLLEQAIGKEVVLAGCGPLLWHLAGRMIDAKRPPALVLDTSPGRLWRLVARSPFGLLTQPDIQAELKMQLRVRRKVKVVQPAGALSIESKADRKQVVWQRKGGGRMVAPADLVLLHQGLVPDLAVCRLAGCRLGWNAARACWQPDADVWGRTSVAAVLVAGDAAGIAGFESAVARGHLAGYAAAQDLGAIDIRKRVRGSLVHLRILRRYARGRALLDTLARPAPAFCETDQVRSPATLSD
ncbi:Thioredoxin reductase [Arboricoccus pini]|uniref:Thioredoxin reductase n=1 Tax=Arboricoccus pini TaxID=1963835 RepID=A0A212PWB6_9PROT|nr:FAD-dependent oxidoreductase [Arboricoccus pini]SNB51185.1 Thioredoxin reductase [Arboricoccus pini]